jgi:hypothetical protein
VFNFSNSLLKAVTFILQLCCALTRFPQKLRLLLTLLRIGSLAERGVLASKTLHYPAKAVHNLFKLLLSARVPRRSSRRRVASTLFTAKELLNTVLKSLSFCTLLLALEAEL